MADRTAAASSNPGLPEAEEEARRPVGQRPVDSSGVIEQLVAPMQSQEFTDGAPREVDDLDVVNNPYEGRGSAYQQTPPQWGIDPSEDIHDWGNWMYHPNRLLVDEED